jgi:hypothetical protein
VILPTVAIPTRTPAPAPADSLTATLDSIDSRVAALRELFSLSKLERRFITRDELMAHLHDELEEDRQEILDAQELYTTLGIIPKDFDLYDLLVRLYSEQVLGFFDPEEKKMYVVDDETEFTPGDALTYAHEFVHGLQQQHFDIHSTIESVKGDSDKSMAFRALIEGDATLVQSVYAFQHFNLAERSKIQEEARSRESPAFDDAPYVIQRLFVFPYLEGPQFVLTLVRAANGWDMINQSLKDIPLSTEHILHPEKYMAKEPPIAVELPDLAQALGQGWTQVSRDTLGEFLIRTYLEMEIPPDEASAAADGWGGDGYALLKDSQARRLLASRIAWDSEDHAREFFDAFLKFTEARTEGKWEILDGDETSRTLTLPGETIYLNLDAVNVLLIITPDSATLEAARAALQGD